MVSLHPDVYAQQTVETFAQKSGSHQQHHGEGQFDHHKVGAEAAPHYPSRTATAFCQALLHVGQGHARNRSDREQHSREECDRAREGHHTEIQAESLQIGHTAHHVGRDEPREELHDPISGD